MIYREGVGERGKGVVEGDIVMWGSEWVWWGGWERGLGDVRVGG